MLTERRSYPKVAIDGEASLEISGIVRSGNLLNVTPSGVQIECRRQLVERLAEFKRDSGLYPDFDVEFELPEQGRAVRSSCNVSQCRRLSQNVYQLELSFVGLSPADEARVDAFISDRCASR
jgi:hypothetical protein